MNAGSATGSGESLGRSCSPEANTGLRDSDKLMDILCMSGQVVALEMQEHVKRNRKAALQPQVYALFLKD
jgi:hypothetical protein